MTNKFFSSAFFIQDMPRLLFGGLALSGGVMHFTVPYQNWQNVFIDQLYSTGYMWQFIGMVNIVFGGLLVFKKFEFMSLLALLPITLNIFLLHFFIRSHDGLYIGIPMLVLNLYCLYFHRSKFKQLLEA
jgi:putative oxidoreductase